MGLKVCFSQTIHGYVRVNLGRGKIRMAQQLLNHPNVRASVKQMGRITMPQFVRGDVRWQATQTQV